MSREEEGKSFLHLII